MIGTPLSVQQSTLRHVASSSLLRCQRHRIEAIAGMENACGEFYTLDKNGNRVELFVDPTNGQIIGRI
jgi:hypothetical protein